MSWTWKKQLFGGAVRQAQIQSAQSMAFALEKPTKQRWAKAKHLLTDLLLLFLLILVDSFPGYLPCTCTERIMNAHAINALKGDKRLSSEEEKKTFSFDKDSDTTRDFPPSAPSSCHPAGIQGPSPSKSDFRPHPRIQNPPL